MDNTSEFTINDRSAGWPFTGRAKTAKDFVLAAYIRAAAAAQTVLDAMHRSYDHEPTRRAIAAELEGGDE